jgi:hypothetical protein
MRAERQSHAQSEAEADVTVVQVLRPIHPFPVDTDGLICLLGEDQQAVAIVLGRATGARQRRPCMKSATVFPDPSSQHCRVDAYQRVVDATAFLLLLPGYLE